MSHWSNTWNQKDWLFKMKSRFITNIANIQISINETLYRLMMNSSFLKVKDFFCLVTLWRLHRQVCAVLFATIPLGAYLNLWGLWNGPTPMFSLSFTLCQFKWQETSTEWGEFISDLDIQHNHFIPSTWILLPCPNWYLQ